MRKGFYYDEYYDALVVYSGFKHVLQYEPESDKWFRWNESFFYDLNRLEYIGK